MPRVRFAPKLPLHLSVGVSVDLAASHATCMMAAVPGGSWRCRPFPITAGSVPPTGELPKGREYPNQKLFTAQNFHLCSSCSAGAHRLWTLRFYLLIFLICLSVCQARGRLDLRGLHVARAGCKGNFSWGLVSAPEGASAFYS